MKLANIHVENYRALKGVSVPLSQFTCFVGKNNSGKSSLLQAISLLRNGGPIKLSDRYDQDKPVRIALEFSEITTTDLTKISDSQHRSRLSEFIVAGRLTLVRSYDLDSKSKLKIETLVPKESRLRSENVAIAIAGKSGADLRVAAEGLEDRVKSALPEGKLTQALVKQSVDRVIRSLGPEELEHADVVLPTGLDASILPLLPEVIYIPAVKDVSDEIKTTGSATLGRLLAILFEEIHDQIDDIEEQFKSLQGKLSRVFDDGVEVDRRLPAVRTIEATLNKYVQHNFPGVDLRLTVPAPELRAVLSGAELTADDGTDGPIAAKGDGLKRAVAFAILQAYAEIRSVGLSESLVAGTGSDETSVTPVRSKYVLLFEEPELYLHPSAQKDLYRALGSFAEEHEVLVTTHSPNFVDSNYTRRIVKVWKEAPAAPLAPYALCKSVDLSDLRHKDALQLICFENNDAALFGETVVLIEGDSDYVALPRVAQRLHTSWKTYGGGVVFVRVGGKGNLERYKKFFEHFDVEVHLICDLDAITQGFDKLLPSPEAIAARDEVMRHLSRLTAGADLTVTQRKASTMGRRGDFRASWDIVKKAHSLWKNDESQWESFESSMNSFIQEFEAPVNYELLKKSTDAALILAKQELLDALGRQGVHVWWRGCLEDYYPIDLNGGDKVEKAIAFASLVDNGEDLDGVQDLQGGSAVSAEMRGILHRISPVALRNED